MKNKIRRIFIIILMIICFGNLIYSCYNIFVWKKDVNANKEIKEELNELITVNGEDEETKYEIDFNELKKQNNDVVAYIKVNNTNIDYIVVKGNDNKYYLSHNFNKKYNISGWIFADFHNLFDETDKNIVIYGHNMNDGSMFGTLKNVLNKEWYLNEENRNIVLITESGTYHYEVFSTYSVIPEDYYINTQFKSDDEFEKFIKTIKNRSIYDYQVDVSSSDKMLTLSSCTVDGKKRVVLHAKLIND